MDRGSLELLLGQGLSVEKIAKRFGKHPSTVSYWMAKHGLTAVNREKHSARGGIERERLESLVDAGMTIAQIARACGLSKATVRHWMGRYGLRTENARTGSARGIAIAARDAGLLTVRMSCKRHGETVFVLEGRGQYRCKRCRSETISRRRRRVKEVLVLEAGGRCCVCGYDRHPAALQFHHLDPSVKLLPVSTASANGASLDALRAEARKCVLLCSNCHAEVESGITTVPLK